MTQPLLLGALLSLLSAFATPVNAGSGDWPQFRGPGGLAVADDTPLPKTFGPGDHVLWKAPVPPGHSSPCIQGDRIFLSGFADGKNVLLALDRTSGKVLWRREVGEAPYAPTMHPDAVPASPTAAADEERVVFYLGNHGLVALDHDGETLWEKRLPQPRFAFGVGSSPLLYEGVLVVDRDGAPEAAILGLDAADGSELWRIDRFEFAESHTTPFLWRNADRDELVVAGSNRLSSYDPASADLLWTVGGLTTLVCTTPTADEDTLYFGGWSTPNATGRSFWEGGFSRSLEVTDEEIEKPELLFQRLDLDGDGKVIKDELPECRGKDAFVFIDVDGSGAWELDEITGAGNQNAPGQNLMVAVARGAEDGAADGHVRWSWSRGLPYVSSPLLYRGRIWLAKAGGFMTCLDAATGEPVFDRQRLSDRSEYYMSPVGAGGRVIVGSAEGTLTVLDAEADELSVLHTAEFDDELFATPAVLDGTVFLRSKTTMWAFGGAD